jgi:hypothetical protein
VLCNKCFEYLPDDAKFCLKCGQAVGSVKVDAIPVSKPFVVHKEKLPQARNNSSIAIVVILLLLLAGGWWIATSTQPFAQRTREIASGAHTEAVTEKTLSVSAHSFSSYKFSVPAGAVNVMVGGQFASKDGAENEVQVYVLSDEAFVTWRNGFAISPYYDSGKVVQGSIQAELPIGEGTYYLVFNNNFSVKTAKTVQADVSLHYNTWWPDWLFHLKDKLWSA